MYRVRYGRKRWRTRWPWKWLFPLTVDERFCPECRLPYQNGPHPKEKKQFTSGEVAAIVYPAGGWKRGDYCVRFGRWRSHGRDYFLSQYFSEEDLDDLAKVTVQAHGYVDAHSQRRVTRR